ncbi:hypothetical protein BD560DRAFT_442660 [Blakeslea trispora]|nr:hypothetical protein BD560DRAFT_442660 [Blakeslea trispora]
MATTRSKIPSSKVLSDTNKKSSLTSSSMTSLNVTSRKTSSLNVTSAANSNSTNSSSSIRPSPSASKRAAAAKKALTSTANGGVSKNTPPVSVLTGKTRKSSRLIPSSAAPSVEKKRVTRQKVEPKSSSRGSALPVSAVRSDNSPQPAKEKATKAMTTKTKTSKERTRNAKTANAKTANAKTTKQKVLKREPSKEIPTTKEQVEEPQTVPLQEPDNKNEEKEPEKENEPSIEASSSVHTIESNLTEDTKADHSINDDTTIPENPIVTLHQEEKELSPQYPISHISTGSSVATADEHDAEVAATTTKAIHQQQTHTEQELPQQQHHDHQLSSSVQSGRSSFSPNSVISLPRPETPEVDQLRLRFENIIQTSTPTTIDMVRRRSSPKIAPEIAHRIKDMKPRGPVGSRVKSMVELFMDENLNKWEF